jgi:hypothetical protein
MTVFQARAVLVHVLQEGDAGEDSDGAPVQKGVRQVDVVDPVTV